VQQCSFLEVLLDVQVHSDMVLSAKTATFPGHLAPKRYVFWYLRTEAATMKHGHYAIHYTT
jgi:hypothetical protein